MDLEYDDVIIGSSPLLLLVAAELAARGRRVCVLESQPEIGGAWRTATLPGGDEVEVACHLIEVFPDVYRHLERVTSTRFIPLKEQPVRLHRTGVQLAYFSRIMLLLSGLRLVVGLIVEGLPNRIRRDSNAWLNYRTKLRSFLRFQCRALVRAPRIEGPALGFAHFLAQLVLACERVDVHFHRVTVSRANHVGGVWTLTGANGLSEIRAKTVHMTTAASLRPRGPGCFESVRHRPSVRVAFVIDVENFHVQTRHSYVAFWKDAYVSRIARVDGAHPDPSRTRFLIEARPSDCDPKEITEELLLAKLCHARIVRPDASIRVAGTVSYSYARPADHLPEGEIDKDVYSYFSSGNLAAGIASWLHSTAPSAPRGVIAPESRGRQCG